MKFYRTKDKKIFLTSTILEYNFSFTVILNATFQNHKIFLSKTLFVSFRTQITGRFVAKVFTRKREWKIAKISRLAPVH